MAMRKFYAFAVFAAATLASLVSCQKEISDPAEGVRTVHFTVKASLDPQTRTYLSESGGVYSAKWSYDPSKNIADQIGVFFGEFENNVTSTDAVFEISDVTSDVATFSGEGTVGSDAITFTSFYPASAFTRTYANSCIGLKVEKTQKPVLGSFDPDMDILMGKQKDITISSSNVELDDLQFARVMAILRVNVNAKDNSAAVAGKTITSLKFIAANTTLTGTASVSAETAEISSWTQSNNEVIANIDASESVTVNETEGVNAVYLVVNPTTIAAGTSLTFTVGMSDGSTYTRILTAPAMEFLAAKVTEINLTLRDKDLVEDDYSGDYLIVSKGASTNWAVMNKTLGSSSSASYLGATVTEVAYDAVVDFTSSSVSFGDFSDADHKWALTKVSGGYTIKDADGKYLGVTSATHATLNDDAVTLKVEAEAGNVYAITNADASLALKYNSGTPRFTFYASGQSDLYLIPFVETCKAPVIICANNQVTISCGTDGASVYYTIDGTTEPTSSSTLYSAPFAITANTTVKAIAIKDGLVSSAVTTTLCEYNAGGAEYVKVSGDQEDWSGTYILTNDAGTVAFNGTISTTSTKYGLYTSITTTDSGNKIESNATNDSYAIVVEKSGSHYTMQIGSGAYLFWTSGNSLNANNSLQSDNKSLWDFEYMTSGIVISNVNTSGRVIRFNSDRFACYTTGAGVGTNLYKYTLSDGKSDAGVSLSYSGGAITYGDAPVQLTLSNPNGVTLTCSSSKTSVATVTNAGLVTIAGAGDATITAAWNEQTINGVAYRAGSVTYDLTVAKATPIIAPFGNPTTTVAVGSTVTNTTTISNGLTITYTSSKTNVATVNASGVVTGVADGTAIISATFAGNDNFNAAISQSYSITVGAGSSGTSVSYTWSFPFSGTTAGTPVESNESADATIAPYKANGDLNNINWTSTTNGSHLNAAGYSAIKVPISSSTTGFSITGSAYSWKSGKYNAITVPMAYVTSANSTEVSVTSVGTTTSGTTSIDESVTLASGYAEDNGVLIIKFKTTSNFGFEGTLTVTVYSN